MSPAACNMDAQLRLCRTRENRKIRECGMEEERDAITCLFVGDEDSERSLAVCGRLFPVRI